MRVFILGTEFEILCNNAKMNLSESFISDFISINNTFIFFFYLVFNNLSNSSIRSRKEVVMPELLGL
jgi:hypothetical protein